MAIDSMTIFRSCGNLVTVELEPKVYKCTFSSGRFSFNCAMYMPSSYKASSINCKHLQSIALFTFKIASYNVEQNLCRWCMGRYSIGNGHHVEMSIWCAIYRVVFLRACMAMSTFNGAKQERVANFILCMM